MLKKYKKSIKILIFLLFFLILFYFIFLNFEKIQTFFISPNINISDDKIKSSVIRVVDGDTIILDVKGTEKRIRLIGLNTPEINNENIECFGLEATEKANYILKTNSKVFLKYDYYREKKDKFGRHLGYIFLYDGQNFAEIMIRKGYGYEYTFRKKKYEYQELFKLTEEYAKKNNLGLWNACK